MCAYGARANKSSNNEKFFLLQLACEAHLEPAVDEGKRDKGGCQEGLAVGQHSHDAQHGEENSQQDVQDERQRVIRGGRVGGEAVQYAAGRGGAKKRRRRSRHRRQKSLMQPLRSYQAAARE